MAAPELLEVLPNPALVWLTSRSWLPACLLVLAVLQTILVPVLGSLQRRATEATLEVTQGVGALLVSMEEATGVPLKYLGASVYSVRAPRWKPSQWHRLRREYRFKLWAEQASEVKWRAGKGAVGQAWSTKGPVHVPWLDIADQIRLAPAVTDELLAQLDSTRVSEFTKQELGDLGPKYAEVLAVPIKASAGAVVGVLSVDVLALAEGQNSRNGHRKPLELGHVLAPHVGLVSEVAARLNRSPLVKGAAA